MKSQILKAKNELARPLLAAVLCTGLVIGGCTLDGGAGEGRESGGESRGLEATEAGGGGEHPGGAEGDEGGREGTGGGEEGSGAMLAPGDTFDTVRAGARLIMNYDPASNAFLGTVENTTAGALTRVRVEVHLSNGTELGPTNPVDLGPGQTLSITLPSTQAPFNGWVPHVEVGGGEGGSGGEGAGAEGSGGEGHGPGGEGGAEGAGGQGGLGAEAGEAAMSSPTVALDQTWEGNLGGLAVFARYDAATQSVESTVRNTLPQVLCYVQSEPHLKSGGTTVGELGPDVLGHLSPGQSAVSSVSVNTEPGLAGVSFDGYVIHLEVFDCAGTGPVPHTGGEGGEGGGGEGTGGEGHGPGGESGAEGAGGEGGGGEEGSGAMLAPDQTFDMIRAGARLIMSYDAASNTFTGTVQNTTNGVLTRVRVEIHLSNGTELGPTVPVDLEPGEIYSISLDSTTAPFSGWVPHAEVGRGEGGGGESGIESGGEGAGEHGSGGEGGHGA
ncbi:MAG: hypothetical protein F4Y46_06000 [Chloroflexi bacterium]|nr:hypothetical protein [Chloroflexota bacterium]